jgi:MoaA/NifB/PqqE/SkfB family radical SAM enzyme
MYHYHMPSANFNYALNLVSLFHGQQLMRPLIVTYYVTTWCNLNCAYCEDFGSRRNAQNIPPLPLDQTLHILKVIRSATNQVILTGGEPLLHPQIDELVARAHTELKLNLTMLTNAALLHEHEAVLPHLKRLVVSLDSTDVDFWSGVIQAPTHTAAKIMDNIAHYAQLQGRHGYRMILNCVISPETLSGVPAVLDFCKQHQVMVSFSPQSVMNWPNYDLLVSEEYKTLIREIIQEKKQGAPILGSMAYLRTLLEFTPYACYPTLAPRIMPNGDLSYPCRPIEKDNNGHGGLPCNLLELNNWDEAVTLALDAYGNPPMHCASCYQQCFAEPSLMQAHPFQWLVEKVRYPVSRKGSLKTFAPGS